MMVEVPSAALMAREFAREVDFFSIGTNDLIQYTLAVDRANQTVSGLYSSGDPSLLRLIQNIVRAGDEQQIPVTVCGQMSSDPLYVPLLLGLGVRQLSVAPQAVSEIKEILLRLTIEQSQKIAERAQSFDVARDVENYLRDELGKLDSSLVR
jgi:phosphotransferase system enzyme I (PtsI)